MTEPTLERVPLDKIDGADLELREDLEDPDLEDLARSIGKLGLIHPPRLRREGDRFRVVAGGRRIRATRLLGWREVPAIVDDPGGPPAAEQSLVENLHRRDLNPVEEAAAFAALIAHHGYTPGQLARQIGRTPDYIETRGAILDWPEEIREALRRGEIKLAAARELAQVDDPAHRTYLLTWAIKQGATASLVASWVHDYKMQRVAAEARGGNYQSPGSNVQPPEPTLQCAFCAEWKNLRDIEILRACSKCRAQMYGPDAGGRAGGA